MNEKTIIIGAGPAGASAALYLARFCHEVILLDAPKQVHGRTHMANTLRNFLGNPLLTPGPEFLSRVAVQLKEHGIKTIQEKVTKVSKTSEGFRVKTEASTYEGKYVIVAVGVKDVMPEAANMDPYYQSGIFHCLTCDWYEHRDQPAAVIADDDRGITTALALDFMERPKRLCVIPAKPKPTFSAKMLERAKTKDITVYTSPIKELKGVFGYLKSVVLADGTEVKVEVLFTKLGHQRIDQFLDAGGIKLDREKEEGFIKVNWRNFESSMPNLFAVGPCNEGPDQAIIAGGQGAIAAMEIHGRILTAAGI